MRTRILVCFGAALVIWGSPALANSALIETGRELARINCASCHNIEAKGNSPFTPAPPFRAIALKYDPHDLEEAFVEGIVVGHPAMPEWEMTPEQAAALASFIESLGK